MPQAICTVGNFLSKYGHTPQICELLANNFCQEGHTVIRAGKTLRRVARAVEMAGLPILYRNHYKVALIDTFSGAAFQWARFSGLAVSLAGRPYIAILHGGNLPRYHKIRPGAVENYLANAACLVSPSRYLQRWAGTLGHSVEVIPNPLEIQHFSYRPRETLRPRLFWFRRFHKLYNPAMAIKTVSHLIRRFPDIRLVMAGPDGGELENCRRLARHLSLSSVIIFMRRLSKPEVNATGAESDIFLNTADIDNAPVSMVEAAAMGIPMVSTRVGGISDLFSDGKEVLLTPAGDAAAMAEKISLLLNTPKVAAEMARNAHKKTKQWTWPYVYPQWLELFRRIGIQ